MKKILTLILVLAVVLSVSGVALAEEPNGNLNIADGSIVIDADGYTQGTDAKVTYAGDYVITQTSDKTTDKTITINSVATGATVTLQNLNMVYEVNNEKGPIIVNASTTLILDGTNTLKGGFNGGESNTLGALAIGDNAVVTIQGTGILNATGVKRVAGIYVGSNAVLTIAEGTINATGGDMAAPGIGASNYMPKTSPAGTIIISGGTVTAKGGKSGGVGYAAAIGGVKQNAETTKRDAAKVQITGGTVNATSGDAQYVDAIFANEMSITGGTVVCDKFPTITGKKMVKLSFYDDDGAALAGKEVTVGSWNAVTDDKGVVYMYLDSAATNVTATVEGESEARTANINGDEALFAPNCTCTAGSGTIEWVGSFEDVTLYNGVDSREIAISAKYVAGDGCKAPVHGDFETVTIMENSDHAVYADGKLTVNRHTDNYEVTLSATANGTSAESKTIKVTIETMKGFDLMAGTITFDGIKYTQDGVEYTPAEDEKVIVYGSGTTDNYLEVTAGTANVILDNVDITAAARGDYMDAKGIIRVFGGELNLTLKGANTLERGRGGLINVGKESSTNAGDAVLNIMGDDSASLTLNSTPADGSGAAGSALIGGYSGSTMAGTINIQGGNIIIPNACGVGIGSPRGSTSGSAEYHYDINISGGSVDIKEVNQLCTGIGMGCGAGEDAVVNVNITGGNVNVASTYNGNDAGIAIGASGYAKGSMNIAIGDKSNPSKTDPVVNVATGDNMLAIGAAGGSSVDLKIDIFGGDVTAKSGPVAIGGSISGGETRGIESCQITISGGKVTATADYLAIGVAGPAGYPDTETAVKRKIDASIEISGDANVTATASKMAIGMLDMGVNSKMDIAIKDTATVEATATGAGVEEGAVIAIGTEKGEYADKYNAAPTANTTSIAITSPNVTMNADKPLAAATETTLAGGTAYTVKTDKGTMTVTVPDGADSTINDEDVILPAGTKIEDDKGNTIVLTKDGKLDEVDTTPSTSGSSSYSGPSIWYIGGNTFGTSTTRMPTSVEIDYVSVPFTMEGSNIVVSCINPGARWATVKWNSTSATIRFNPDANVVCAQVVIPKTGDMPIWAAIAEFLGF